MRRWLPPSTTLLPVLTVLGVLLFVLGFVLAPGYACSDVGYGGETGEPPGGFGFEGVAAGALHWTPDGGVNTCSVGLGIVATPIGASLVVTALVVRYRS